MGLSTEQASFTRYADGSVHIISSGGVDPLLTQHEGTSLETYLTATEANIGATVSAITQSVTDAFAATDAATLAAAIAAELAATEVLPADD